MLSEPEQEGENLFRPSRRENMEIEWDNYCAHIDIAEIMRYDIMVIGKIIQTTNATLPTNIYKEELLCST